MKIRMVPIGPLFQRFHRLIRDLCKERDRKAKLVTSGEGTELDKKLIDELTDPLMHLIRNSVDHGLESPEDRIKAGKSEEGEVALDAYHEGGQICVRVRDNGKGLDVNKIKKKAIKNGIVTEAVAERMPDEDAYGLIFQPGFSTAETVTNISGRGVGMDIVKSKVEELKGKIEIQSQKGQGCTFIIRLPLTLAMIDALLVNIGKTRYAFPLESVCEIVEVAPEDIRTVEGKGEVIFLRNNVISFLDLEDVIDLDRLKKKGQSLRAVVAGTGKSPVAIAVDSVIGEEEVVVKALTEEFENVVGISGATVLGDGGIGLILDVDSIIREARMLKKVSDNAEWEES
jgi:two-component system chemotaxis sensor kinase CheA